MARRPKSVPVLEAAFRDAQRTDRAYEFLSEGIGACLENASSLSQEFACLAGNRFNARAQFVMATAMEELGKALILFDFVRIPWDKASWIGALCGAFYHHLSKAAYAKTVYFPGSGLIADALILFKLELIEYRPNLDPQSGEPDEHAAGLVDREWGLYVDWNGFDAHCHRPNSSTLAYYYAQEEARDGVRVGQDRIDRVLFALLTAESEGLFAPEGLKLAHQILASIHVSVDTSEQTAIGVSEYLGDVFEGRGIHLSSETVHSNFMCYPLYAAIVTPDAIKGYWER